MVTIEVVAFGQGKLTTASISAGKWDTTNPKVLHALNSLHLPFDYYPDKDWALAVLAVEKFGGQITNHPAPPTKPTGTIDEGIISLPQNVFASLDLDVAIEELEASGKATYPANHKAGMKVTKGGSCCANCEYLGDDKKTCTNEYFIKWLGSDIIPGEIESYCSDWWEPA